MSKTFAETYTMRSRHYQLLGEAGKMLAQAYLEADHENQEAIKAHVLEAMVHSLVEHHRLTREDIHGA
jgi:hypothetical protein